MTSQLVLKMSLNNSIQRVSIKTFKPKFYKTTNEIYVIKNIRFHKIWNKMYALKNPNLPVSLTASRDISDWTTSEWMNRVDSCIIKQLCVSSISYNSSDKSGWLPVRVHSKCIQPFGFLAKPILSVPLTAAVKFNPTVLLEGLLCFNLTPKPEAQTTPVITCCL